MPGGHQVAAQILPRADQIAQRLELGRRDLTARSCPAACNRASFSASRMSVLTRSPGWRGIAPGEQTITSSPAALAARASPNPVGPAS